LQTDDPVCRLVLGYGTYVVVGGIVGALVLVVTAAWLSFRFCCNLCGGTKPQVTHRCAAHLNLAAETVQLQWQCSAPTAGWARPPDSCFGQRPRCDALQHGAARCNTARRVATFARCNMTHHHVRRRAGAVFFF
jgi:hypothetical protein